MTALHILVGLAGALLILAMLAEFFVAFMLPRRVKRAPNIARSTYLLAWRPWRRMATRLDERSGDTWLGIFGPTILLGSLVVWTLGIMLGFALLHWACGSHLGPGGRPVSFLSDVDFSAGGFLSASENLQAHSSSAKLLVLLTAGAGLTVFFIAIGYLPSLFQAFSSREVAVSQLDPRAGSPPSASVIRAARGGGWPELDRYLAQWEAWAAELMETHLSYPVLGWFRSQHVNQNWLAALVCVLDTCAFARAAAPDGEPTSGAELTFAIGRHALSDLRHTFDAQTPQIDRLDDDDLDRLCERLRGEGLTLRVIDREHFAQTRASDEPQAAGIATALALPLPGWMPAEEADTNWRRALQGAVH